MIKSLIVFAVCFVLFSIAVINGLGTKVGEYLHTSYDSAMTGVKNDEDPDYVLDPDKPAPDTKLIYKGKVIMINGTKVEASDIGLGISLNQKATDDKLN